MNMSIADMQETSFLSSMSPVTLAFFTDHSEI